MTGTSSKRALPTPPAPAAKRLIDLVVAVLALVALLPVFAAVGVLIKLDSRGPVIFRDVRIGRGGVPFTLYKFRTMCAGASDEPHRRYIKQLMRSDAPEDRQGMFKLQDDPRVTRVGRVLRATSVDELPQLLNVIRGDMSLVGPRPDVPYAVEEYEPRHHRRFDVLPGMTGLWQVSGRGELSPRDMLELDLEYVQRRSLALDLWILTATVPAVVRKVGSA